MQKQKQKQNSKKQSQQKRVPSAIVLGSQDAQITEFLHHQSEFSCVQGEKLFLYISNKLVLLKPKGLPLQKQQREKYLEDLQIIFKLDYRTLTKIFLIVTDSDFNDTINYFSEKLKKYQSHIILIHIQDVETQDDPIKISPSLDGFENAIQCYINDNISEEIVNYCQLDEDSVNNPPCEEMQFDPVQQDNKQLQKKNYPSIKQKAKLWQCLEILINIFKIPSFNQLHPKLKI